MEKFGVDQSNDETKEAAAPTLPERCKKCGAILESHGNVRLCPNCGSEPLEQPKKN